MGLARWMDLRDEPESSAARSIEMAGVDAPMGVSALTPCFKFAILAPTMARSFSESWLRNGCIFVDAFEQLGDLVPHDRLNPAGGESFQLGRQCANP